ncbi:sulfite exporter TauE/SafE family protein [Dyadobacter psychrotolerans]|uniref:Probable membrane transporter protein n=1 Tax=Dyadobacter psychrotolerans TaxID=2541721 RepID=A0A4R5D9Q7_9BACT|nr:sulfite exporter TauE/SafE family protein [Dyadobacter psychrotolerans]TDE08164.1 sulfite exporter TauE/SafE family protein [Dyadobacter psychrotolerans]
MELTAYLASVFIGISLGLIGGGGSILTVPLLVYMFGISPLVSTSYSLFIVGSTSLVGAYNNYRKGAVKIRTALLFGSTSVTTVFFTRKFLIPLIPRELFKIGHLQITESLLTMILFAVLMVIASVGMIRSKERKQGCLECDLKGNIIKMLLSGVGIGLTTGILGAGGGFLLIPTLVLVMGMPMKEAVGTSLLIVALNSLIGFVGDFGHFMIDWIFLLKITAIAMAGILIGGLIAKRINARSLKKAFGWFVLIMGIYIISTELLHLK